MPVPKPLPNEKESDFISRCIKFLMDEKPNRDKQQAIAIAYSQWRNRENMGYLHCPNCGKDEVIPIYYSGDGTNPHASDNPIFNQCLSCDYTWQEKEQEQMHADFERIQTTFIKRYGEAEGMEKFQRFIKLNGLDVEKQYHPRIQFAEGFQWIEPLILYYKSDSEAKYYKVTALTANISMNNNDYSDYEKMKRAAPSLSYRPVNINHDHSRWQSFPRTRMDFSKADDLSVEAILRVDNNEKRLQKQLDHDPSIPEKEWINHPSIEGRPFPDGSDYYLSGMALLEKGYQLPGDPLTQIEPLFLGESVGAKVCKVINGMIVCANSDGIIGESIIESKSKEKEEKTLTEQSEPKLEEAEAKPEADEKDEKIVVVERASALKDKKIAELTLFGKEALDKVHAQDVEIVGLKTAIKTREEEARTAVRLKEEELNAIIKSRDDEVSSLKSTIRIKEDEVAKLKTDVEAANDKMTKEVAELKRISREQMRLTEDGFAQTKTRQDKEIQELAGKVGKLETEKLDCQKDILDLQHERNQSSDREKKAVEDMLEARNEVAKTSEKFADLQAEVAGASKRLNEANNKTVQESKDKQVYIEKLTQLEQNHNKTVNLLKQAIRKMAEDKQFFQEPDGTVITDKDIQ